MPTQKPSPPAVTSGKRPRMAPANSTAVTSPNETPSKAKPIKTTKKKTTKKAPSSSTAVAVRRPRLIWRTRDQENSSLYNLQLDVGSLQSELQGLRAYREMLKNRVLNRQDDLDGSFVRIVREYFRVFRNGYHGTGMPDAPPPRPRMLALASSPYDNTETDVPSPDEFLQRVMDEHVIVGRFPGLPQMMKMWKRYSSVFGPITLSYMDSHVLSTFRGPGEGQDQVLVTSRAQYHLYISLRTIQIMFPHILPHQELVTRILGQRITGVGRFDFVFDTARNRIVRYEFSLDLTASFIDLLGDPALVALLLNDALISDEFYIGDLSEFVPGPASPPLSSLVTHEDEQEREEDAESREEERSEPSSDDQPPSGGSWKMTISSILSPADDEDNEEEMEEEEEERGAEMDVSEPLAEHGLVNDAHHIPHFQVRFERV